MHENARMYSLVWNLIHRMNGDIEVSEYRYRKDGVAGPIARWIMEHPLQNNPRSIARYVLFNRPAALKGIGGINRDSYISKRYAPEWIEYNRMAILISAVLAMKRRDKLRRG